MNIQKMMKQAAKMQEQAAKMQEQLAEKTLEVSVGGGKVTVTSNGVGDILAIKIAKEVVDPDDVEMLEDLVLSGVKQAIQQGQELAKTEMGRLTAGLGLPPGML